LNQTPRFNIGQFFLASVVFVPIFIATRRVAFNSEPVKISELKNYSTDEKRDIYSSFEEDGQKDQGLPLDPFDLMNRLRKAGAMNDATTPSDALDEALNAFDQSEYKNVPIE
tara:strand:+ start:113 stop:448 length:336 start_codon:yes stop_codon:yes gene_type:complete